jgi:hypothetical protein
LSLEKFEVVKYEPCRFIGKTVYARAYQKMESGEIFKSLSLMITAFPFSDIISQVRRKIRRKYNRDNQNRSL